MNSTTITSDDSELIHSIAVGDPEAFTILYDRHSSILYSVAFHILGNREEALDVIQQVFLKVLKKAGIYHAAKGKPAAWLVTMTRNQSLDRIRQMKSHRSIGEKFYEDSLCIHQSSHQEARYGQHMDEVELLNGAMGALRQDEINVLHLAYFRGLSQTEISVRLAQPLGSVKARIRRALGKLRAALDEKMHIMIETSAASANNRAAV